MQCFVHSGISLQTSIDSFKHKVQFFCVFLVEQHKPSKDPVKYLDDKLLLKTELH